MKFKLFAGALATAVSMSASAGPVFSSASYNASMTFLDKNPGTTMTLAFDGTNYYSGSGGGSSSPIAKYDASGNFIASTSPTPGIDFRSVFTNSSNDVLARGFASSAIYKQTSTFGTFTQVLTLGSPTPDVQSAVVLNSQGSEYISRVVATVNRWDLAGNALAQVTLTGSPTVTATGYPSGRGIAAAGGYWLTYAAQTVYAWDYSGNLLDSALLNGAGTITTPSTTRDQPRPDIGTNGGTTLPERALGFGLAPRPSPAVQPAADRETAQSGGGLSCCFSSPKGSAGKTRGPFDFLYGMASGAVKRTSGK